MKKSVMKSVSLLFAVVMMLSAMSMVAFATEDEVALCGAGGTGCAHPHLMYTEHTEYVYANDNGHYAYEGIMYTCPLCDYSYFEIESQWFELHTAPNSCGKCTY